MNDLWDDDPTDKPDKPKKPKGAFSVVIDYEQIRKEPWLVELNAKLSKPRYKVDPSIVGELRKIAARNKDSYQNGNPRLPVVRSKEDMIILMDENARCLADRDRVTEILVSHVAVRYMLDALWEKAGSRALELPAFQRLTNQPAREAFLTAMLDTIHASRNQVRKIVQMAEIIQEHLTHTHFSIQQHSRMGEVVLGARSA